MKFGFTEKLMLARLQELNVCRKTYRKEIGPFTRDFMFHILNNKIVDIEPFRNTYPNHSDEEIKVMYYLKTFIGNNIKSRENLFEMARFTIDLKIAAEDDVYLFNKLSKGDDLNEA